MKMDWLIVGAGFTGCVLAERIATQLNQKVLLVDQRNHIGGNSYDTYDEKGILIHQYGPHIFHTNAQHVWDYLSQFTTWRYYHHRVLAVVDGKQVPVPFNFNSLYALFPTKYADKLAKKLIAKYGMDVKVPILNIRESEKNGDLKFLADFIYEKVFHHYTQKQWGLKPDELGASVTARVPIYLSHDDRYFQDPYQGMPQHGYTALINRLLAHPNIKILLNTQYQEIADVIKYKKMVYTGPIDEFFDYMHGDLPYRSLHFNFVHTEQEHHQSVATVNYPNDFDFTRITEFKHLTGQKAYGSTYAVEYPRVYLKGENTPYYPIPREEHKALSHQYKLESEKMKDKVIFAGRLGDYQYYNMDQAVARALHLFEKEVVKT